MRIFGLLLLGLSSITFIVITVLFFSFYNSLSQTEYLFDQYKSSGVYNSISSAVKDQIDEPQEDSDIEQTQEEQIQEQFINALFSEQTVEDLIEKNITRLNEFIHSDQKTFTAYTPFSDSSMTDSIMSQMGIGELAQDPEFKKMFQQSSQNMMSQNNPFESFTPLAQNLKTSFAIMKYLFPILTAISLVLFILLGRGVGRVRNVGILAILTSLNLGFLYVVWRVIYSMGTQRGGWSDENVGTKIAGGILSPLILLSAEWIGKFALFVLVIGIVCIVVWVVMRANKPKAIKKAPVHKKRT